MGSPAAERRPTAARPAQVGRGDRRSPDQRGVARRGGRCSRCLVSSPAALEDPDIEVLQVATSLLDLRLQRQGFFQRARELGRTVYVHSIYLQGVAHLEPECLPPPLSGLVESMGMIRGLARELGVPTRALYLAFVRDLPGVVPLLGCEKAAQLQQGLEDWASEAVDAAQLTPLVDALPALPEQLLDPSRWPRFEMGAGRHRAANQPTATSVATIPP